MKECSLPDILLLSCAAQSLRWEDREYSDSKAHLSVWHGTHTRLAGFTAKATIITTQLETKLDGFVFRSHLYEHRYASTKARLFLPSCSSPNMSKPFLKQHVHFVRAGPSVAARLLSLLGED
jgi:hypothetical protein